MRPIIRREKPEWRSFVHQLRRQRNSRADSLLLTNERWTYDEVVPKGPNCHTAQKEATQARPPIGARAVQSLTQPQPGPRSGNQPHPTASSKQGHGDRSLGRPPAEGRHQQRRVQQSARHQGPQETGEKYAAWCIDQGTNAAPERAASRLHPGRLARQKQHHETPGKHRNVHEGPGRTHGMGLLGDPGKTLHRHGHCGTGAGVSRQAAQMVGGQPSQAAAFLPMPMNDLFAGSRCRRIDWAGANHGAARCRAHDQAVRAPHQAHHQRSPGQRTHHVR